MFGLIVALTQEVMLRHREVIRDDEIIVLVGPVRARHGPTLPGGMPKATVDI